jgi:hypothetical protein
MKLADPIKSELSGLFREPRQSWSILEEYAK